MTGYAIDWGYIRDELGRYKGDASYRTLADELPQMSFQTCYRFLAKGSILDLTSLLAVMSLLRLEPADCVIADFMGQRS